MKENRCKKCRSVIAHGDEQGNMTPLIVYNTDGMFVREDPFPATVREKALYGWLEASPMTQPLPARQRNTIRCSYCGRTNKFHGVKVL